MYQPFTWLQNGVKIAIFPASRKYLLVELLRVEILITDFVMYIFTQYLQRGFWAKYVILPFKLTTTIHTLSHKLSVLFYLLSETVKTFPSTNTVYSSILLSNPQSSICNRPNWNNSAFEPLNQITMKLIIKSIWDSEANIN